MNDDRALEQRFLDRAKALSNVAEVFRCSEVTLLICEMVAFGVRAEAKIFEAAYGEPSGQKYWERKARSQSKALASAPTPPWRLFGQPNILEGEDAAAYNELLDRVRAAVFFYFKLYSKQNEAKIINDFKG